ncbi:MAG: cation transporter [Proteobacteria bacterium]|nr:MAG: cation transporter [Pseudomonadota bacterium]
MEKSSLSRDAKLRLFGGLLSLGLGLGIMAMKFLAYRLTGSTALLSDALESVVNVVAAAFALWAVRAAEAPPDPEHPYGHGKLEFVTAVFEGGLISFAAIMIGYEAINALVHGAAAPNLDRGLGIVAVAGALNGFLGFVLIGIGRRTHSAALIADGKHVLTDFFTTIGILGGLALVKITGYAWLDPVIALLMAGLLASTGIPLVREAISALIDAADEKLLEAMLISFERHRRPGIIRLHHVRAMRNGRRIHVDGHVVVPEFWTVDEAHEETEAFETDVVTESFSEGEMEFHLDPCRRAYCRSCEVAPCPIRREPFAHRPPLSLLELLSPVDITDRALSPASPEAKN